MDKRAKELLEWAVEHSSPSTDVPKAPSSKLDPSIIDAILGPDDSTLMVDSMKAIKDASLDLEDRIIAFENLELLVEQIDNASNLEVLKLWPPLLSMLSSPEAQLRRQAAWVIGTAVQNNPKAQGHLLQYKGVKKLVDKLNDEYPVRTKVLYALGSELGHFPAGVKQFTEAKGWEKLRRCVDNVDDGTDCQKRVAFFLANYLTEEGVSTKEIEELGFLNGLVDILGDQRFSNEVDLIDKTLQAVAMLVTKGLGTSNTEAVSKLKRLLPNIKSQHLDAMDQDHWEMLEGALENL